jgi:two-component system chemotaxis response regulator CheY
MFLDDDSDQRRRRIRFLIVDDHAGSRGLVKSVLTQSGFTRVKACENGSEALKYLLEQEVDIVVCDWNMPVMTGIELLEQVRSHEKVKDLPFIMLTAQQQQNEVVMAFSQGVSDYIIKPFTPETLLNKVKRVLKKNNLL